MCGSRTQVQRRLIPRVRETRSKFFRNMSNIDPSSVYHFCYLISGKSHDIQNPELWMVVTQSFTQFSSLVKQTFIVTIYHIKTCVFFDCDYELTMSSPVTVDCWLWLWVSSPLPRVDYWPIVTVKEDYREKQKLLKKKRMWLWDTPLRNILISLLYM